MTQQIIYGIHAVTARLKQQPETIVQLHFVRGRLNPRLQQLMDLAEQQQVGVGRVDKTYLAELAGSGQHQGVLATITESGTRAAHSVESIIETVDSSTLVLILDGVQDPHNLGACLRVANGAGVTAVIAPKDKTCGITAVVSKVASGAAESTPYIQVTNLVRAIE